MERDVLGLSIQPIDGQNIPRISEETLDAYVRIILELVSPSEESESIPNQNTNITNGGSLVNFYRRPSTGECSLNVIKVVHLPKTFAQLSKALHLHELFHDNTIPIKVERYRRMTQGFREQLAAAELKDDKGERDLTQDKIFEQWKEFDLNLGVESYDPTWPLKVLNNLGLDIVHNHKVDAILYQVAAVSTPTIVGLSQIGFWESGIVGMIAGGVVIFTKNIVKNGAGKLKELRSHEDDYPLIP